MVDSRITGPDASDLRALVVGGGSMGKRRVRCLIAHGFRLNHVALCDLQDARREQVGSEFGIQTHSDLITALSQSPEVVFVCVPGAYHIEVCLAAARANANIFCEVPLSLSLDGIVELKEIVDSNNLQFAPACQQAFHPLYSNAKVWLQQSTFAKLCFHNQTWGCYLPDWHPYEDYRKFYASDPELGGGNLDVLAHEITVALWLTGQHITEVHCRAAQRSSLEIRGPDYMNVFALTNRGMPMNLEFDLIQRTARNEFCYVSEEGTLELQIHGSPELRRYLAGSKDWEIVQLPADYRYEQCYIDEVGHFLSCLRGNATWPISFDDAIYAVKFLLAVRKSITSGNSEEL